MCFVVKDGDGSEWLLKNFRALNKHRPINTPDIPYRPTIQAMWKLERTPRIFMSMRKFGYRSDEDLTDNAVIV